LPKPKKPAYPIHHLRKTSAKVDPMNGAEVRKKNRKTKPQTPEKIQISNSNAMAQQRLLGLGAWDFSGAWCLEFGVSTHRQS
jgi:hypothetical protein